LFEGLFNDAINLSSEEWEALVRNDLDQDHPEGRILLCLAKAPLLIRRGKHAKLNCEDLTPLAEEVRPIYEKCKYILGELKARKVKCESSDLGGNLKKFLPRLMQAHYLRTYGIGLGITLVFNCMLQALNPEDFNYSTESISLVEEILLHAEESNMYRPVAAAYIRTCLGAAWAATTDLNLRLRVEATLFDYEGDLLIHNRNLFQELEDSKNSLWLSSSRQDYGSALLST
jgi:hypothetical protein